MRIILVVPNEPFYVSKNIDYLINSLKKNKHLIVSCVLLSPSPYGRRESFFSKSIKVYNIFGINFFLYYGINFIHQKFFSKSVKEILKSNNVNIIKLKDSINKDSSILEIKEHKPDLIISVLANEIFKKDVLDLPTFGCINLHTSLLPKFRGMMPTFWVLLKNEKYTGVTVFLMDDGVDTGPIISQRKILIREDMSQKELIIKTKKIGMELLVECVEKIKIGKIKYIPNSKNHGTYFSFPTKDDVKIFLKNGKKFF